MTAPEKESAEALRLRAKPRPVTRLNRKVIAVLLLLIGLMVLLAFAWGLRKPPKSPGAVPNTPDVERVARAEGLASLPKDYTGVPKLGAPTGEFGRSILKAERDAGLPELPERSNFRPSPEEEVLRAQRLKEQNEAEEAAKAAVIAHLKSTGQRPLAAVTPDTANTDRRSPTSDFLQALGASPVNGLSRPEDPNQQADKQAFVEKNTDSKIYASATLQTPRSPYQLMAGSVISAALVTGIKSDLPGQVIATITENVFDSVTGRELLIPQGSRLLGQYDSQVSFGQSRVLLVWTRLIMPNGSSIVLDRLSATDTEGYAGLEDGVDWHWRRIFAGAALSTLLGAGAELAAPDRSDGSGNVIVAAQRGIQDSVNQVGQELTRRNLNIQPTLTERPGLPLKVIVNKDLILRPYGQASEFP